MVQAKIYDNRREMANEEVSGMRNLPSLRRSQSAYSDYYRELNRTKRLAEEEERNRPYGRAIELTDDLFGEILRQLGEPPRGARATRVFQQHTGMGLCWSDSFFIMFFEADATKPIVIGLLKEFYSALKDGGGGGGGPPTLEINRKKMTAIARFMKRARGSAAPLPTWELLAAALQRYLLLGFLFTIEPPAEGGRFLQRRLSIWGSQQNYIHDLLKYGIYCEIGSGLSKRNIIQFMSEMGELVAELSNGRIGIESSQSVINPSKVRGYYFSIQEYSEPEVRKSLSNQQFFLRQYAVPVNTEIESLADFYGSAHIISLFHCVDGWYLYDNEAGVVRLSDEESVAVSTVGIDSIQMSKSPTHSIYECTLYGGIKFRVLLDNPSSVEEEEIFRALTIKTASFRMVEAEAVGGGKRRRRKTRRHRARRYTRSSGCSSRIR